MARLEHLKVDDFVTGVGIAVALAVLGALWWGIRWAARRVQRWIVSKRRECDDCGKVVPVWFGQDLSEIANDATKLLSSTFTCYVCKGEEEKYPTVLNQRALRARAISRVNSLPTAPPDVAKKAARLIRDEERKQKEERAEKGSKNDTHLP